MIPVSVTDRDTQVIVARSQVESVYVAFYPDATRSFSEGG